MFICHAVALPDVGSVPPEGLGPEAPAEIVFAKPQLEFPAVAVGKLLREHGPIPPERVTKLLAALRPDSALVGNEGQDIYPHWFASLERLLDPNGPRKFFVVADPSQAIYAKPWTPPVANRSRCKAAFSSALGKHVVSSVRIDASSAFAAEIPAGTYTVTVDTGDNALPLCVLMPMLLWRSVVTPVSAESTFWYLPRVAHRVDEKSMPRRSATLVDATVTSGAVTC